MKRLFFCGFVYGEIPANLKTGLFFIDYRYNIIFKFGK